MNEKFKKFWWRWIVSLFITFLFSFILIWLFITDGTIDLIKGNSFYLDHLFEIFWYDFKHAFYFTQFVMVFEQIVFWIFEIFNKKNKKAYVYIILIPVISFMIVVFIAIITLPLWFRISF